MNIQFIVLYHYVHSLQAKQTIKTTNKANQINTILNLSIKWLILVFLIS